MQSGGKADYNRADALPYYYVAPKELKRQPTLFCLCVLWYCQNFYNLFLQEFPCFATLPAKEQKKESETTGHHCL